MGAACFSHRALADPESECQEGPSKSQEKKYVEHRGSPLEQTNKSTFLGKTEGKTRILQLHINSSTPENESSSDYEKKKPKAYIILGHTHAAIPQAMHPVRAVQAGSVLVEQTCCSTSKKEIEKRRLR